jgi:hypothetical protein
MKSRAVPEPVIFDCDGVLVDSEMIFARVLGECMSAAGYPATAEEALELGFGKNRESLTAAVERQRRRRAGHPYRACGSRMSQTRRLHMAILPLDCQCPVHDRNGEPRCRMSATAERPTARRLWRAEFGRQLDHGAPEW